jgi:hypothetical protein
MGYRSNVAIAVTKEIYTEKFLTQKLPRAFNETDETFTTTLGYYFIWLNLKWYDDFNDVREVMDFLGSLDGEDYGYIRIGEEYDDIETRGDPYRFDMSPEISISTPEGHF